MFSTKQVPKKIIAFLETKPKGSYQNIDEILASMTDFEKDTYIGLAIKKEILEPHQSGKFFKVGAKAYDYIADQAED